MVLGARGRSRCGVGARARGRGRRTKRFTLARDQVLAASLTLVGAVVMADDFDALQASFDVAGPPPIFPAVRLAVVAAVVVTTSPHLGLPFRRIGRWLLVLGAGASIVLGAASPLGVLTALALGAIGASVVHLMLGSPGGVPTIEQVALALADLGVEAVDLRPAELEPRGVALVRASSAGGAPLIVKVYGRDARDGQFFITVWGGLWYRDDTSRLAISRRQQVEREGFVTLLAERAGAPVAPVISAGVASGGDALVVVEVDGTPLSEMDPSSIDEGVLRAAWERSRAPPRRRDRPRAVGRGPPARARRLGPHRRSRGGRRHEGLVLARGRRSAAAGRLRPRGGQRPRRRGGRRCDRAGAPGCDPPVPAASGARSRDPTATEDVVGRSRGPRRDGGRCGRGRCSQA